MLSRISREDGASMLVALLFFLIATMVSVVILTASVTTARRVADDRAHEQEGLSVGSAARVVRGMLAESSVTVTWSGTPVEGSEGSYTWSDPVVEGSGRLGGLLSGVVDEVVRTGSLVSESSPAWREAAIDVSWDDERLERCKVRLEAWPTGGVEGDVFDVDVTVRGAMGDWSGDSLMSMPEVRLLGTVTETGATRRCVLSWVDETQVRFVVGTGA